MTSVESTGFRGSVDRGSGGLLRTLVTRVPFTTAVVVVMLVLAVVTGTLWNELSTASWFPRVSFGLPSFQAGRYWTVVSGAFFAIIPLYYVLVAGGFALLVGFTEWRIGTGRTVVVTIAGHLVGVVGCALFLLVFRGTDWPWAVQVATQTDVGFSAGMMAAICVASATVQPPWGLRLKLAACAYPIFSLLYVGLMADLEHGLAVLFAAPLAARLAGPHAVPQGRVAPGEQRLLMAVALGVAVSGQFVVRLFPGNGPTGVTAGGVGSAIALRAAVLIVGWSIAVGLHRGARWAWPAAAVLCGLQLVWSVTVAVLVAGGRQAGIFADAPLAYADGILAIVLLVLLMLTRGAFRRSAAQPVRSPRAAPPSIG